MGWAVTEVPFPSKESVGAVGCTCTGNAMFRAGWYRQVIKCPNACPSATAMLRNVFVYVQWRVFCKIANRHSQQRSWTLERWGFGQDRGLSSFSSLPHLIQTSIRVLRQIISYCKIHREGKRHQRICMYRERLEFKRFFTECFQSSKCFWKLISIFSSFAKKKKKSWGFSAIVLGNLIFLQLRACCFRVP